MSANRNTITLEPAGAPTEIVIDFREAADKIAEVRVNGKTAAYTFRNEHIILPAALTQAGENAIKSSK